ncbi:Hypothetical predicted protein [Olea europaea subsp. europaea]|uniref:Uncharacterized protein n=1 Tax=Olea europaea subsp. europaea TaxID=158383 RepID=A0A8S0RZS7_OLEEU|nr:Hypothetical predicted protein [Olea europaea subsp. europaea]
MGGCATKPKVSKGDETEASPPVSKEEVEEKEVATVGEEAAKDEGVVIDNDTKRQSLGFLFENDGKLGSSESDKSTNELVDLTSSETRQASDVLAEAKPQENVHVKSSELVASTEASNEKKEIVKPTADSLETEPSETIKEVKSVENAKVDTLEEKRPEEKPITPDQTNSLETETLQKVTEDKQVDTKAETAEEKKIEDKPITSD